MSLAACVGWLMIGVAVAAVIVQRRPGVSPSAGATADAGDGAPPADTATDAAATAADEAWCRAVAELCGGSVFLFDEGLRLIACGGPVSEAVQRRSVSPHLIDFGTAHETAMLLGHASAARRGERATWRMPWEGGEAATAAVAFDGRKLLLHLQSAGR